MAKSNAITVINAGSSSIKFSLFSDSGGDLAVFLSGQIEGLSTGSAHFVAHDAKGGQAGEKRWDGASITHDDAMRYILDFIQNHLGDHKVEAVGHRIVHGGEKYAEPVRLDATVLAELEQLIPLAPLHQPHNLSPIRSLFEIAPHLPQVGCFDTAFHSVQPPLARAFALPATITRRGVRRYGFHGLSYEYIASVALA
jgi:acetate kinase